MRLVAPICHPSKSSEGPATRAPSNKAVCGQQEARQSSFSFLLTEALELESHVLNLLSLYFYFPTDRLNVLNWVIRIWRQARAWMISEGPKRNQTGQIILWLREWAAQNKLGK